MAVDYMDPNRPKAIKVPQSANPPAETNGPGSGGDGMWPTGSESNADRIRKPAAPR